MRKRRTHLTTAALTQVLCGAAVIWVSWGAWPRNSFAVSTAKGFGEFFQGGHPNLTALPPDVTIDPPLILEEAVSVRLATLVAAAEGRFLSAERLAALWAGDQPKDITAILINANLHYRTGDFVTAAALYDRVATEADNWDVASRHLISERRQIARLLSAVWLSRHGEPERAAEMLEAGGLQHSTDVLSLYVQSRRAVTSAGSARGAVERLRSCRFSLPPQRDLLAAIDGVARELAASGLWTLEETTAVRSYVRARQFFQDSTFCSDPQFADSRQSTPLNMGFVPDCSVGFPRSWTFQTWAGAGYQDSVFAAHVEPGLTKDDPVSIVVATVAACEADGRPTAHAGVSPHWLRTNGKRVLRLRFNYRTPPLGRSELYILFSAKKREVGTTVLRLTETEGQWRETQGSFTIPANAEQLFLNFRAFAPGSLAIRSLHVELV